MLTPINHGVVHMCVDIGWLLEMSDRKLTSLMRDNGKRPKARDVRNYLYDCLRKGWHVLPLGEPCEGFDYVTGCPGHPNETLTPTPEGQGDE